MLQEIVTGGGLAWIYNIRIRRCKVAPGSAMPGADSDTEGLPRRNGKVLSSTCDADGTSVLMNYTVTLLVLASINHYS